jgi:hypothetical protein
MTTVDSTTKLDVIKIAAALGEEHRAGKLTREESSDALYFLVYSKLGHSLDSYASMANILGATAFVNRGFAPLAGMAETAAGGEKVVAMLRASLQEGKLGEFVEQIREEPITGQDLIKAFEKKSEAA